MNKIIILLGLCLIFISGNVFCADSKQQNQSDGNDQPKSGKSDDARGAGAIPNLDLNTLNQWIKGHLFQINMEMAQEGNKSKKELEKILNTSILTLNNFQDTKLNKEQIPSSSIKVATDFILEGSNVVKLGKKSKLPPLELTRPTSDSIVIKSGEKSVFAQNINGMFIPIKAGAWIFNKKALTSHEQPLFVWKDTFNTKKCRRIYEVLKRNTNEINTCASSLDKLNKQLAPAFLTDETSDQIRDKDYYSQKPTWMSRFDEINGTSNISDNVHSKSTTIPPISPTDSTFNFGLKTLMEAQQALADCDDNNLNQFYTNDTLWKDYDLYPKDSTGQKQITKAGKAKQQ
ncbi:MAG: hypothetical protein A2577_03930 [Bdellovibrionales bacterium RIFOXYD1_FULL_36_51]|nr:MAG: hypothetical protein A2417_07790 [Bdellovibrionales bacterium RIFOXYC1_FULL_37_79]OFZ65411.1 MAG: hypothetical protein A2577_03930 [Bdellovibrionales bacterium RIFOXYD1_FULL_36_51]